MGKTKKSCQSAIKSFIQNQITEYKPRRDEVCELLADMIRDSAAKSKPLPRIIDLACVLGISERATFTHLYRLREEGKVKLIKLKSGRRAYIPNTKEFIDG